MRSLGSFVKSSGHLVLCCVAGLAWPGLSLGFQLEAPSVGVNLEGVKDHARARVFVDAMKSARKFGPPQMPWGEIVPVDEEGWPTTDFGVVVMTAVDTTFGDISGTYTLSFDGAASVSTLNNKSMIGGAYYDPSFNRTFAEVVVFPGASQLMLSFTSTRRDGMTPNTGLTNVRLIRPGYPHDTDQVFHTPFLEKLQPFSVLRFLDWTSANNSDEITWDERSLPTSPLQSVDHGVAWEYMIELANIMHKDMWITVPHCADNAYIENLARLFRDQLDPSLCVYLEYSNEVWNRGFSQYHDNYDDAGVEVQELGDPARLAFDGSTNPAVWAWRRTANRAIENARVFREVFGETKGFGRVRPVLCTQVSNPNVILKQLDYVESVHGAPRSFFWAFGGAPYFKTKEADVDGTTVERVLDDMENSDLSIGDAVAAHRALALHYGVHFYAYEAGPHLVGEKNLEIKVAANRHPRMLGLCRDYLQRWNSHGGELMMWYTLSGKSNKFGCWGIFEDLDQSSTPKFEGIFAGLFSPPTINPLGWVVPAVLPASSHVVYGKAPEPGSDVVIKSGQSLDYLVWIKKGRNLRLKLEVEAPQADAVAGVRVNGQKPSTLVLSAPGSPKGFLWSPPVTISLNTGLNVIRITSTGPSSFKLRSVDVTTETVKTK